MWAEATAVAAYGVRVGLRVSHAGTLQSLFTALPHRNRSTTAGRVDCLYSVVVGDETGRGARRLHLLYRDATRVARTRRWDEVVDALAADVRQSVAALAPRHVFVHAGVVSIGGRAVLLPGKTFTGKSTLVAALVSAGATYYSDEFAVVDALGRIQPFIKPISLRPDRSFRQIDHAPETFGKVGREAIPMGAVIVTHYREGARFRPRALTTAQGVLALMANTVALGRRPQTRLATLAQTTSHALVWKGARGEAAAAADTLMAKLAG